MSYWMKRDNNFLYFSGIFSVDVHFNFEFKMYVWYIVRDRRYDILMFYALWSCSRHWLQYTIEME